MHDSKMLDVSTLGTDQAGLSSLYLDPYTRSWLGLFLGF